MTARMAANAEDLEELLGEAAELFEAESASVMLPDEDGRLRIKAAYGIDPYVVENVCIDGGCTRGFGSNSACVYRTGRPRLVKNDSELASAYYKSNSMCLPVYHRREVIGVFNISNRADGDFTKDDMLSAIRFVGTVAGRIYRHYKEPAARMPGSSRDIWHNQIIHAQPQGGG